jgi:hypothetical protein
MPTKTNGDWRSEKWNCEEKDKCSALDRIMKVFEKSINRSERDKYAMPENILVYKKKKLCIKMVSNVEVKEREIIF